jgi:hypothetical protein
MIIRLSQDRIRYVIDTCIHLPKGIIDAYEIVGVKLNGHGGCLYERPVHLPNLQHLVDHIVFKEAAI